MMLTNGVVTAFNDGTNANDDTLQNNPGNDSDN